MQVLTFLRELRGETLRRELVERWRKHNLIVSSEMNIFRYVITFQCGPFHGPNKSAQVLSAIW
jgi:hypothetical protein